jgi:hypothetical protein
MREREAVKITVDMRTGILAVVMEWDEAWAWEVAGMISFASNIGMTIVANNLLRGYSIVTSVAL